MQRRTAIIIVILLPVLFWLTWTVKATIENLARKNDIAGTRTVDGKTQCYFFNDPDTYEVDYFEGAKRYYTRILGNDRVFTNGEMGITFQLPSEYNYYVFQNNALFSGDEYHDVIIMPFSDVGCASAFLHNSISAQKTPWPGMPGGKPIKEPNPDVIVEHKTFGGREVEVHTIPNETMESYMTYYLDHAGVYYFFTTGRTAEDKFVMEEILKSLVFLE